MTAVDKFLLKWGFTLVALMCAVALAGYGCGRSYAGKLAERAKRQEATVKDLGHRADSIRTVYVHDTVTAYRYLTEWERIADTLRLRDTTYISSDIPGPARRLLVKADSTIRSCTETLYTCDQLQAAEHARADSALALAKTYKAMHAPWVQPYVEGLRDLSGGYVAAGGVTLGHRLALTARGEVPIGGGPVRIYGGVRINF